MLHFPLRKKTDHPGTALGTPADFKRSVDDPRRYFMIFIPIPLPAGEIGPAAIPDPLSLMESSIAPPGGDRAQSSPWSHDVPDRIGDRLLRDPERCVATRWSMTGAVGIEPEPAGDAIAVLDRDRIIAQRIGQAVLLDFHGI